ncbi:hypothetical protein A1O3_09650 [Capronia epimyces CBS 606.96]|uniref:SPX domain-containing protein n=1 Tax=Capronia epimyces CBS 606.96 TaxID=1182542 RepID=W9Y4Q7_9EURO|nr:uncharacterized protein A1O3_09650 [Capronia epimyces CBS 606.96]EXJ77424.1 hypothetical protein A1O3_09650 [Capronia epimyces CBS 606.96]
MKFGETLFQRSVPKWAAYNVNYNEIKNLIKERTSAGVAVPRDIPAQGKSRWEELENQLFKLLSAEYDNVTLFLRSKQGEIERRLAHVEKQVGIARRAVQGNALDKPILQARRYRQLVKDIEEIGDEIQNLARFAAVQRTAFRKILKKYRKWTGSTSLQTRLEVEVFSSGKLRTDFSDYLRQLSEVKTILTQELAGPMLTGRSRENLPNRLQQEQTSTRAKKSAIAQIEGALLCDPLAFDAAVLTEPYGEAAGSAFYWIHPDNLDEARMLLLRHMRDPAGSRPHSRRTSTASEDVRRKVASLSNANSALSHMALYDNAQRFIKDASHSKPARIALSASWSRDPEAVVTLAGLSPTSSDGTTVIFSRKELARALQRDSAASGISNEACTVRNYLIEHRDIKPLAEVSLHRSRYVGMTNTAEVANWAMLDTAVTVAPVDISQLGEPQPQSHIGYAFPYAVLHIRWEFARTPAVVRAFDESHLVERVFDFTLEDMAIYTVQKELPQPSWRPLLEKDIRKVPIVPRISRPGILARTRLSASDVVGSSSGPSSSDGPPDSIFSGLAGGPSSVTSDDGGRNRGPSATAQPKPETIKGRRKKHARIQVPEREPPTKYWNEFDDGDSDVNPGDEYVIYIDPNGPVFPGAETVSKAFGAVCDSFSRGTGKMISWLPLVSTRMGYRTDGERAPLLADRQSSEGDPESSSSDTDSVIMPQRQRPHKGRRRRDRSQRQNSGVYRPHQLLSPRQRALERTLFFFYSGLLAIAYVLLVMSGILLATGRRKAFVEVDAGVVAGVIFAEACVMAAVILIFMRKQRLGILHWGLVAVAVASVVVIGVGLLALMFANIKTAKEKNGHSKPAHG